MILKRRNLESNCYNYYINYYIINRFNTTKEIINLRQLKKERSIKYWIFFILFLWYIFNFKLYNKKY